jgi:hypothetical protein
MPDPIDRILAIARGEEPEQPRRSHPAVQEALAYERGEPDLAAARARGAQVISDQAVQQDPIDRIFAAMEGKPPEDQASRYERIRATLPVEESYGNQSTAEFAKRNLIPFYSSFGVRRREEEQLKGAVQRASEGKATDDDLRLLAVREAREQKAKNAGFTESLAEPLGRGAAMIPEFYATRGASSALLPFRGAGLAGQAAMGTARLGVQTALMPETYEAATARAKGPGESLRPENLGPAFAEQLIQNAIIGRLGEAGGSVAKAAPTAGGKLAAQALVGAATMPAEQQGADLVTSAVDELLPEAYRVNTRYGLVGKMLRKEPGVERDFALQAVTGAIFASLHAPEEERKKTFEAALKQQVEQGHAAMDHMPELAKMINSEMVKLRNDLGANKAQLEKDLEFSRRPRTREQPLPVAGAERAPSEPPITPPEGEIAPPRAANAFSGLGNGQETAIERPEPPQTAQPTIPASPLDRLRAKQQPIEAKPQPTRNGLRSLSPEIPAEAEQPPEFDKGEAFNPVREFSDRFLPKSGASPEDQAIAKRLAEGESVRAVAADAGVSPETARQVGAKLAKQFNAKYESARQIFNEFSGSPGELQAKAERTTPEELGKGGDREGVLRLPSVDTEGLDRLVNFTREAVGQSFPATTRLSRETSAKLGEVSNLPRFRSQMGDLLFDKLFGKHDEPTQQRLMDTMQEERFRQNGKTGKFMADPDYQASVQSPEYKEFAQGWEQHMTPWAEEQFRTAQGMPAGHPIASVTQIPNRPYTAIPVEFAPNQPIGGKGKLGNLQNVRTKKLGAAQGAKLEADEYVRDPRTLVENMVNTRAESATRADYFRTAESEGTGKFVLPNAPPEEGWRDVDKVKPPPGSQAAQDNMKWRVKEKTYDDTIRAFGVADPYKPFPLTGGPLKLINRLNMAGVTEFLSHTANLMTAPFKGVRIQDIAAKVIPLMQGDVKLREDAVELARIGALSRGGEPHGLFGGGKADPTSWPGRALDLMDKAVRITAGETYDRLQPNGDQAGKRDFVNRVAANYNVRSQNEMVRFLRETQINPFATATVHFWGDSLRTFLMADPGIKANTYGEAAKLRGMVVLRNASLLALIPVANYLAWGRADGGDDVPVGGLKTGQDEQGRSRYIDLARLTPWGRGAKYAGVGAVAEGLRGEKTGEEIASDAAGAMTRPLTRLPGGIGQLVHTASTGQDAMGRQVAGNSPGERAVGAAFGVNPLGSSLREEATGFYNKNVAGPLGAAELPESPEGKRSLTDRLWNVTGPLAVKRGKGEGGKALADTYELKKQYLAKTGRADESAPQASAIAPLRDAALADDSDQFKKAYQAYIDRAKAAGKSRDRFDQDLRSSLHRLDPLASLSKDDRDRFYRSLSEKQQQKVKAAQAYAATVQKKIGTMIRQAK